MANKNQRVNYVCTQCGEPYLTKEQKEQDEILTFHIGICGVCGKKRGVTHIRAYNWLQDLKRYE